MNNIAKPIKYQNGYLFVDFEATGIGYYFANQGQELFYWEYPNSQPAPECFAAKIICTSAELDLPNIPRIDFHSTPSSVLPESSTGKYTKQDLINLVESIFNYENESVSRICEFDRTPKGVVNLFLTKEKPTSTKLPDDMKGEEYENKMRELGADEDLINEPDDEENFDKQNLIIRLNELIDFSLKGKHISDPYLREALRQAISLLKSTPNPPAGEVSEEEIISVLEFAAKHYHTFGDGEFRPKAFKISERHKIENLTAKQVYEKFKDVN